MRHTWVVRLCFVVVAFQSFDSSAFAFKRETRIPLVGHRQYSAASGSARLFEIRRVTKEKDREELVVEVINVPLTPGTVLVVYVGDEQVGNINLNAKRSGRLKLTSDFRKFIPQIDAGTSVVVKTLEGRTVMQ